MLELDKLMRKIIALSKEFCFDEMGKRSEEMVAKWLHQKVNVVILHFENLTVCRLEYQNMSQPIKNIYWVGKTGCGRRCDEQWESLLPIWRWISGSPHCALEEYSKREEISMNQDYACLYSRNDVVYSK